MKKRRNKQVEQPSAFLSNHLKELEASFKGRRKALQPTQSRSLEICRSMERIDDDDLEKFSCEIRFSHKKWNIINLSIWEDRYAILSIRHQFQSGNYADHRVEGRIAASDMSFVVPTIEDTVLLFNRAEGHEFNLNVEKIWNGVIRGGPRSPDWRDKI